MTYEDIIKAAQEIAQLDPAKLGEVDKDHIKHFLADAHYTWVKNSDEPGNHWYRDSAKAIYGSDDIEIDNDAVVSRGDAGAFVQAWVWVQGGPEDESDEEQAHGD